MSFFVGIKLCNHDFGPVIKPERNNTVSQAAADYHVSIIRQKYSSVILWEQALIRRDKPPDQRQPKLPAVCVTAEHQIYIAGCIAVKQLRTV